MGERTRNHNWNETSLGSPEQWPQSLRTTVSILLTSRFPMFLWWGDDLLQFYNDAYRPSLGTNGKHPTALGQRGEDCWPEIWPTIKPLIDQVLGGGEATWSEDQLMPIYRNGKLEDVYWTFSYSPVNDESGRPAGVFVTCTETTAKVANVKRLEESEDQLRFAIDATELGVWDYNPLTNTFRGNNRLKDWFGLAPEEEIEPTLAINEMAENDRQRVAEAIQHSLQYSSGGHYDIEYTIIHPVTNKERIVRAKGRAWFNDEKIAYRFNGTLQDITEQVLNHKKIEESEARFRSLITAAPLGIGLFMGRELVIEMPNQAFIDIVGKGDSIIGKTLAEAMPELEDQPFLQILDEVYTGGKIFQTSGTQVNIVQNGVMNHGFYDFSYTPLFNTDGNVYAILDIAVDVTERVLSRKALEESERNLRNTILQAPVAMCILKGPQFVVEIANERIIELWGSTAEAVTGKSIFEGVPEVKGQGFEALLDNVYNTGETYKAFGVPLNVLRNGSIQTVYVDFVFEAFREADGSISGVMAVAIDVTGQVMVRKKIEESEARFRLMADAMPQFVWTGDADGNLHYFNQAVYHFSGLNEEQIQKDGWLQIVHPDDREENIVLWMNSMQTGADFIFQHRFKNSEGDYRWQLSRAVPQRDSEGNIQLWIGTSTDIHESKLFSEELTRQVKERTAELENKNKELEQFAYIASHDLQEPIRKVSTFTQMLQKNLGEVDERSQNYLDKINISTSRMITLIRDVLHFSQLSKERETFEQVDLAELLETIKSDFELLIEQKETTINYTDLPVVHALPLQMYQLFSNLLSNALKFSRTDVKPIITISATRLSGEALKQYPSLQAGGAYHNITFRDNGIGFNQENAEQIFGIFQRLHGRFEYAGTGIGLALCKKIAQNHRGDIFATGHKNSGAVFNVLLPA